MEKMKEIQFEKPTIEEMRIENRVSLTKVYMGGGDEYITISGNDVSVIDRFLDAGDKLEALANELDEKHLKSDEIDYKKEMEMRKGFSDKAVKIMDGVFGEGTTRKFFGDVYDVIPNFHPDLECFLDFWDALIPVIERLAEHKVKLEKLASKARMAKYQPLDHKRPSRKSTAKKA